MDKTIKILLLKKDVTMQELANRLDTSRQNLSNKFKRNNFSTNELIDIAKALNVSLEISFIDGDDKTSFHC